jgi:hypothetical protein
MLVAFKKKNYKLENLGQKWQRFKHIPVDV